MLKKFLSKLFTGLYVSSLLLTVLPQTAFAAVTEASFVDQTGASTTQVHLETGEAFNFQIEIVADADTSGSYTFIAPGLGNPNNENPVEMTSFSGSAMILVAANFYPIAGTYNADWCFTETGADTPICAHLDVIVTDPAAPLTGALTSSGPYSQTTGYQIPVNQFVYFDFLIDGVPNLPEINNDPATPSAYLDYTVDYGDGTVFEGSFPVTSNTEDTYHIKDRTYHRTTPIFNDDAYGFIFNTFPWYAQYPQDHFYTNPGPYNLTVRANLRSVTGQDLSGVTPFEAIVPVTVYPETQGPDFAIESAVYDAGADTLTVPVSYTSPEPGISVFAQSADGSDTWKNELLSKLFLEIKGETSVIGTGALVPFTSWTVSSPENFDAGTGMYTTEYSIQIENASTTLGYDPITTPSGAYLLLRDFESGSGPLPTMLVLDANMANNAQTVTEALEMGVNFTTPLPTVEATETVPFTAEITNIPEGTTTLNVGVNLNLGVLEDDYPSTIDVTGQSSYTLHFDDRYFETGVADPSICITTNLDPEAKCDSLSLTVIEDIPMSVAFQDEGMRVETGESFALSAFVDEIPEAATSISYEILDLSAGTFEGQSGTVALEEGETTAFIALNDLSLAELGGHELELCVQNDAEITPACTYLTVEVIPAPLAITSTLDASSVDPGTSVMASFSFQNVDPASANLQAIVQWGDGVTTTVNADPAAYAGETLALSHVYSSEGTYSVQICGNDGRGDACSTQTLTVEPPLDVRLTLEQTGINQVAAHAVVSNLDADATTLPYTINWGEGTVESFSDVANGASSLNLNEAFLYAAEGAYTVEICVQEAAEVACDTQTIDTTLAPLTLNVNGGETAVYTNQAQTLSLDVAGIASFADALDLSVSWGDGTVEETTVTGEDIAAGTYSLPITHAYAAAGTYTFEACGNDGRGELCVSSDVVVKLPLTLELTEPVVTERTISVDSRVEGINTGVSALTYTYTWGDDSEQSFTRAVTPGEVVILGGEHTYAADGIYAPELCVTDGDQEACQTLNVSVALNPIIVDIFASEDPQFLGQDGSIWLDATQLFSGATTATVTTTWGDGSAPETSTIVLPTPGAELHGVLRHTYSLEGTYTIETCVNDGETQSCDSTTLQMVGNDLFASIDSFDATSGMLTYTLGNKGAQGVSSPELLSTQNELSLGEGLVVTQPWSADADLASYTAAGGSLTRTESFDLTELSGKTLTLAVCIDTELAVYDFDTTNNCATLLVSIPEAGTPGFVVTETGDNTQVSEDGDTDTFSVVLSGQPTSDVVLKITSGDTGEGTLNTEALTFTPENWDTAQTVTLTGVNDALADGTQVYFLTVSVSDEASAAAFAELADQTVRAVTTDNDGGRTSTEGGSGGGGNGGAHQNDRPSAGGEDVELSSENPFTDLSADSPYFDAVMDLYGQGIVQGYEDGTFHAENITNRAEFMKFAVVAAGVEETTLSTYGNCFPDVTTQWYASYVCYGKEKGWIQGYPDGLFRPEQTINRVEAIKMVVNVLGLEMKPGFAWDGQLFADTEAGAWYLPFVNIAYSLGLINQPADKLLHPADGMSRGALADLLSRALAL